MIRVVEHAVPRQTLRPSLRLLLTTVSLMVKYQASARQAAVDDRRLVLKHLELALHRAGDLVQVGGGKVADVAFDQGPDALLRIEVRCVGSVAGTR